MYIFCCVFLSVLASIGVVLAGIEFIRAYRAKRTEYICVCFDEALLDSENKPDMLIICRSDAEQEEIINRICDGESRKVYIKKF